MAEVMFYHLERQPLETVLPVLLEKTLERGWRAVVQAGSPERVEALDSTLWTYREDSFLPHGTAKDGAAARHPIFLTAVDENPNAATVRFLVDGADATDFERYTRIIHLFDGRDEEAVARARTAWKHAKAADCAVTYWQQTPAGKWEKKG
ncbi:MAG: DNA polymerase III subunit chi [Hyphomicrobiales bacterium]|nr:DNA polymerase III subunit chi [Hyphomicrobiales bacterium]